MLHHRHVFLSALSRRCLSGKACVLIKKNFSWAQYTNFLFCMAEFPAQSLSLGFQCNVSCCQLPWAGWRPHCVDVLSKMTVLIVAICRHSRTPSPKTNFSRCSVLGTFTSIPEHHSVSNNAHVFDWSNFPHPSENASTFGLNLSAKLTQAVCGRPCSKVLVAQVVGFLRDVHHYTIERALCLLQILPSRQLFQSMLHQEFPGGCRLRSVHFLLTSYLQPLMLVLRGRLQQVARDKLASSETLGVRTIESNSLRLSRSFHFLSKMITISVKPTDVTGRTYELHYQILRCCSCGSPCFLPSHFSSPFWKLLHLFKIGCFCTRYTSVTCLASSFHFPPGLSVYFSNFQVFYEPGPVYMKHLDLNLLK